MCGRYYIEPNGPLLELHDMIMEARAKAAANGVELRTGEVFPSNVAPVIANDLHMNPTVFPMRWGFSRPGGSELIINARSETATSRPLFKQSAVSRRCLIPATSYFEWEQEADGKRKYAIRPAGSEMFYLGGLYIKAADSPVARFTILTRKPSESIAFIHDRMPVIVPASRQADWLSPRIGLGELLEEAEDEMEFRAV